MQFFELIQIQLINYFTRELTLRPNEVFSGTRVTSFSRSGEWCSSFYCRGSCRAWRKRWIACILVRQETSPEDIAGMVSSAGILTSRGGMTSHAAVVARGMGKPCVAGCSSATIHEETKTVTIGDKGAK